jgi:RNA polymerase sigma factor (sigma-70 family)
MRMENGCAERFSSAGRLLEAATLRPSREDSSNPFDAIYDTYAPLLRKIATRKFRVPRSDAEGLVHDVFATYLANPANVRELRPYLIGAICNAARQFWRRADVERTLFCDDIVCAATPDDALLDEVIRNMVIGATLAKLGESCRDTLRRAYLEGDTAATIAADRKTSAGYIRRLLTFCRTRAQAAYRALEQEP